MFHLLLNLSNSIGGYFLVPIYFATCLLFIFFNVPEEFYVGIFSLLIIVTLPVVLIIFIAPLKLKLHEQYNVLKKEKKFRMIILLFCLWIIISGILDLQVNGFKLLNPKSYADLQGIGRYIRHFSTLCWILIPVAFIYFRSLKSKSFFIAYALIFPILIVDRNRLFLSFYTLFLCCLLSYTSIECPKKKYKVKLILYSIVMMCCIIFVVLGKVRSGNSFIVHSSGTMLVENEYPLSNTFINLPVLLQQIILYITTPIFNFATIVVTDFSNPEFLLSQFSPFSRNEFNTYPFAPILVKRFNVGTEFYPFLLYGGLNWVCYSFLFMYFTVLLFSALFKKFPNIFTYLIFIKLSYCALFAGFGPQFYILYNLIVILLMLSLWGGAEYISKFFWFCKARHRTIQYN